MSDPVYLVAGKPTISTGEQSIIWSPVASPTLLSFAGTSFDAVKKALVEAFGAFPVRLNKGEHLIMLRGMAMGAGEGSTPYRQLAEALAAFTDLELRLK